MLFHYNDVRMSTIASQITSLTIVYSTVYSDADQRKQQSCASLAFVWGIHRGPVNSPHKWPVTRKMFPFDDVIMSRITTFTNYPFFLKRGILPQCEYYSYCFGQVNHLICWGIFVRVSQKIIFMEKVPFGPVIGGPSHRMVIMAVMAALSIC